ncbi:MAG: carboxypeptidase-like regulatory domain-containing protein [Lewinellaceae bacterium]|nr:carboxypeptidase-like regulatory domain-containing protein [Lewinellaceae bacterium]
MKSNIHHLLRWYILIVGLLIAGTASAQMKLLPKVHQLSGFVVTDDGEDIRPLELVNVAIVGTNRGTFTNEVGFYSLPVQPGETVDFSFLGYKSVRYTIPDTIQQDYIFYYLNLLHDTLNLPEIVVLPIPSRENFKVEFLALQVNDDLQERAIENLKPYTMNLMMATLPHSGREVSKVYFNQIAIQNYSAGQYRPQPIFDPLAWQRFIKYIKDGKFKKKKDDN